MRNKPVSRNKHTATSRRVNEKPFKTPQTTTIHAYSPSRRKPTKGLLDISYPKTPPTLLLHIPSFSAHTRLSISNPASPVTAHKTQTAIQRTATYPQHPDTAETNTDCVLRGFVRLGNMTEESAVVTRRESTMVLPLY